MNDADLVHAVKEPFAPIQMTTPVDTIVARGRAMRRRHRLSAAATGLAAVATGSTLTVSLLVAGSTPGWTVTREGDGTVAVTIRNLSDPNGLVRKLRQDGVRADFGGNIPFVSRTGRPNRACLRPTTKNPAVRRALTVRTSSDPHLAAFLLHPSAIPAGDTLSIYWDGYSPRGFPAGTKQSAGEGLPGKMHAIPLTVAGDFSFDAVLMDRAGNCL